MKVAIMQPYFMPYIGYFQLINAVDEFIVYDNIEFTKKGWINRNRILVNGKDEYITLPIKKDSDYLMVKDRYLGDNWISEKQKMINRLKESYRKSPNYSVIMPLLEESILYKENNLFIFVLNTLSKICEYIGIKTPITISSTISIDHSLKGEKKVLEICKAVNATEYINPIGGLELYSKDVFKNEGINLQFLKTDSIIYKQFANDFVPWLSIIDVLMFNSREEINKYLTKFKLI
jgi:hypothetical protein